MKSPTVIVLALFGLFAGVASCSQPVDPRAAAFARLPDWRGIWVSERGIHTGISGFT